jgi:hypothetical protein
MSKLFDRRATLTIDTIQINYPAGLRFAFEVERTLLAKPNKSKITIYNLTDEHAAQLEQFDSVPVQLDAGYKDATATIFLGSLRTSGTHRQGPDLLTEIASADGKEAHRKARVKATIAKTATTDAVLREVAKALGVGEGNLNQAATKLKFALSTGNVFSRGTVLSGSASREMTRVCRSLGLEWSIQNGALQIVERGKALAGTAVLVSEATGMIGAPTVDGMGVLSFVSLLNAEIFPGRLMVLKAERLQGQYRIEECQYSGDTHTNSWQVACKAKRF